MQWRTIPGASPILKVPFKTSLGTRRAKTIVQDVRCGRVRDIVQFDDAYSIEVAGRLVRLDDERPTLHFLVEYDEEIIRNQWGSVISKRPLVECTAEYKQTYAGDFRNVYYAKYPSLYMVLEPVADASLYL